MIFCLSSNIQVLFQADALAVFLDAAEGAALSEDSLAALQEMENEVAAGKEDQQLDGR